MKKIVFLALCLIVWQMITSRTAYAASLKQTSRSFVVRNWKGEVETSAEEVEETEETPVLVEEALYTPVDIDAEDVGNEHRDDVPAETEDSSESEGEQSAELEEDVPLTEGAVEVEETVDEPVVDDMDAEPDSVQLVDIPPEDGAVIDIEEAEVPVIDTDEEADKPSA